MLRLAAFSAALTRPLGTCMDLPNVTLVEYEDDEQRRAPASAYALDALSRLEVPTGCAIFPKEIIRPPRRWAGASFDVRRWSVMESGGHFAALEEPAALVEDVRAFFRELR